MRFKLASMELELQNDSKPQVRLNLSLCYDQQRDES